MYKKATFKTLAVIVLAGFFTVSCSQKSSRTTGWAYNDANNGGFEVTEVNDQQIGPGLIAIEGGTFVMGATTDNLTYSWDNSPRKVTVPSFLMDRTEVSNVDYREYIYWLNRVYGQNYPQVVRNAAPRHIGVARPPFVQRAHGGDLLPPSFLQRLSRGRRNLGSG